MSDPDPRLRDALDRRAKLLSPSGNMDRLLARARRRQRNRRVAAGAVALSVFAGVAGGLWLVASGRDPRVPPPPAEEPLVISVGSRVLGMAVDRSAVWVAVHTGGELGEKSGEVLRVDPVSGRIVARFPFVGFDAIGIGEDGVWFTDHVSLDLWRIDPTSNEATEVSGLPATRSDLELALPRGGLETGFGRVWVLLPGRRGVYSFDPASGEIVTEHGPLEHGASMAAGEGGVWVSTTAHQISRLDAESGQPLFEVEVPWLPYDIEVGQGGVWVSGREDGSGVVRRIDADSIEVGSALPAGATPGPLAVTTGGVFAGDEEGRVVRVDTGGGEPETVYKTGTPIAGIEAGEGALWVFTGTRLVRVPAPDVVLVPPPGEKDATVPEGADVCAYPQFLPTYLPWLGPGEALPEPTRSISAAGGGPQGLDPGYSILHWGSPYGDVTREGGPELEGYVSLWRTTEPTGVLEADPDVPPLPDGSEGKVFGPGPGGDDLSIHWADPTPSPYDDDCSETTLVLHMPNVSLDRLRTELFLVAASIGGEPGPTAEEGFAVWPVDTPEEAEREAKALADAPQPVFLEDPEETALTFVRELLTWQDATVRTVHPLKSPPEPAPTMLYEIVRQGDGGRIDVTVRQVIGDRWWAVVSAATPGFEGSIEPEPGRVTVRFDRHGAAVVEGRLGYGTSRNIEHVEEAPDGTSELTYDLRLLGFDSSKPGHLLLLYRGADGNVIGAWAAALPPVT
jgi:streptogramin lyase